MVYRATLGVQQADDRIEVGIADVIVACGQNRARPIGVVGLLHLGGDVVKRLVPADALPLVAAAHLAVRVIGAPTLALHGILDARRRRHVADLGAAARAGAALRHLDGILVLLVGADLQRNAVLHIDLEQAARRPAAAVVHAGTGQPGAGLLGRRGVSAGLGQLALVRGGAARESHERGCSCGGGAPFDEAASSQWCDHIDPPSCDCIRKAPVQVASPLPLTRPMHRRNRPISL